MQAENPCIMHQQKSCRHVCLTAGCNFPRMFCDTCLADHKKHTVIPYSQFEKRYYHFQKIYAVKTEQIRKIFANIRDTFAICIKKAQQRVLKQYLPSYSVASTPKLDHIQSQQLYGIVQNVGSDEKFQEIATSVSTMQKFQAQLEKNVDFISVNMEELNTNIMAAINKTISQVQIAKINSSKIKSVIQNYKSSQFNFTQKYKPVIYTISDNGQCISRNSTASQGLSMYAVLDQPLTKAHDRVNFLILRQERRFMYFGVCDRETFRAFNFKGDLYRMGNKMWAIRQSPMVGANGICLHNSLQEFSNVDRVPFDYGVGDTLSIKYDENKNSISFIKNNDQTFIMPLDDSIKQFYPFVGLKFNKDSVRVYRAENLQGQSLFSKFFKK